MNRSLKSHRSTNYVLYIRYVWTPAKAAGVVLWRDMPSKHSFIVWKTELICKPSHRAEEKESLCSGETDDPLLLFFCNGKETRRVACYHPEAPHAKISPQTRRGNTKRGEARRGPPTARVKPCSHQALIFSPLDASEVTKDETKFDEFHLATNSVEELTVIDMFVARWAQKDTKQKHLLFGT